MSQSPSYPFGGLHVAIIMDGNGRWARSRGLPRTAGHAAGAETVRRIVEAAPGLGVGTLTLYAFSSDNWRRPPAEVGALFRLLGRSIAREADTLAERGVRMTFLGRRDRVPGPLVAAMEKAEAITAGGRVLHLRIAVDYSARDTILRAAREAAAGPADDVAAFEDRLAEAAHSPLPSPEVDLLVRTGGERRLSDFLLFESAYAELLFVDEAWPEMQGADLAAWVAEFQRRDRRFGGLTEKAAS